MSGQDYFPTVRRESLITAFWRLNDGAGVVDATDYASRYGLTGVYATSQVVGPALIQGDSGAGSSLFGTTNSYMSVADVAQLRIAGDVSLEAWVVPYTSPQTAAFVGKMNAGHSIAAPYALGLSGGQIAFSLGNGTTAVTLTGGTPPTSIPSHVVATSFRGTMKVYLNGVVAATGVLAAQAVADGGQPLYVGSIAGSSQFHGLLGEVAVYSGALSARRVARHFTVGQQVLSDPAHYRLVDAPSYT